jgi:hypothetical protein
VYDTSAESQSQQQVKSQTQDEASAVETVENSELATAEGLQREKNDTTKRATPIVTVGEIIQLETQSTSSAQTTPTTTIQVHLVEAEASQYNKSNR